MLMKMGMQMSFYWGKSATLLFSGWPNGSLGMYFLALFFVFFIAAGVEVISIITTSVARPGPTTNSKSIPNAVARSCVYVFQMALAYMVMLSVMSFNGGVFVVAVIGHGVGHFIAKSCARVLNKGREDVLAENNGGVVEMPKESSV
ncbi:unnamed protein product [Rhodiola kirilowii]